MTPRHNLRLREDRDGLCLGNHQPSVSGSAAFTTSASCFAVGKCPFRFAGNFD